MNWQDTVTLYFKVICFKNLFEMKLYKKQGWIYVPVHGLGWLITGVLMVLAAGLFVGIDRHAHSASDTLIGFLPYGTSLAAIYFFIAINTSTNKNDNNNERNNNESRNLRNKGGIDTYGGTLFILAWGCIGSWF